MRRPVLTFALALTIGAMLTIAIAWGCVAFSAATPVKARGFTTGRWPAPVPTGWSTYAEMIFSSRGFGLEQGRAMGVAPASFPRGMAAQTFIVAGWPLHAMAAQRRIVGPAMLQSAKLDDPPGPLHSPKMWREGFALPRQRTWPGVTDGRCLPTQILWRGFLADTALFGLVPWVLLTAPGAVRTARRRRTGRCTHCGYPLAGGLCAECGAVTPPAQP